MKPKLVLPALAAVCFCLPAFAAPAPTPALSQKEALAAQLLGEMHTEKIMGTAFDSIGKMQSQMLAGQKLTPAEQAQVDKQMQKSMEAVKKTVNWDSIKPIFIKIYADNFDASDLQGMIDFYKSPVGQKFIDKQPVIQAQTMQAMGTLMPKIQAAIMKEVLGSSPERDAVSGMRDAGCGMRDAGCGMRDAGCGMRDEIAPRGVCHARKGARRMKELPRGRRRSQERGDARVMGQWCRPSGPYSAQVRRSSAGARHTAAMTARAAAEQST